MNRNKECYNDYVCPYCLNTLDNCVCELFPPYHLIHIDGNIQEHIRILNEKGYRTMYCCEGHGTGSNTYISFIKDYFKEIVMPKRFKYDKKRMILTYSYPNKLTMEEAEKIKKENLEILLEWCRQLPNQNMEN